jgi:predicted TIM-barrel fold metal-dependent hydrolase
VTSYPVVDAWVNPNFGPPSSDELDVGYLFPGLRERWERGTTLPQLIEEMDEAGVDKAVLCAGYGEVDDFDWVEKAVETHPDRFISSVVVDPRGGSKELRRVEHLVTQRGYRMVRSLAFETQIPYDHPYYFPLFAKCEELGVPIGLNVGIPGPLVPGKHQHPLALDEVCHFFPDLVVVMSHGGEPWADLCVKLMLKWKNLYYMSSAFAPKHIPKPIVDYMNTRGADKIMFASDYPLLGFDRCMAEIEAMPFRDEERRRKFMGGNAARVLFGMTFDEAGAPAGAGTSA